MCPIPFLLGSSGEHVRHRVLIVGANFAGLTAAQHLGREHAVTVIDRAAAFDWLPNIHERLPGVSGAGSGAGSGAATTVKTDENR